MTPSAHYRMFARYNEWANGRLYEAAGQLSVEQYRADRGAFFKSVHGTLNHLLVTDRIWMQRFTGEGEAPDRLDAILFETFDELRAARVVRRQAHRPLCRGARRGADSGDDPVSPRLLAGGVRAGTGAGAGALVQPPDPSPRPGPCGPDRPGRCRRRSSICCFSSVWPRNPLPDLAAGAAGRGMSVFCRTGANAVNLCIRCHERHLIC